MVYICFLINGKTSDTLVKTVGESISKPKPQDTIPITNPWYVNGPPVSPGKAL